MKKTIVYLIGISKYNTKSNDLPYCYNDILAMYYAMTYGLNINFKYIKAFGLGGSVTTKEFLDILSEMKNEKGDNIILYFSGHGDKNGNLFFSDEKEVSIQKIIDQLKSLSIKNRLFIIDSCYSGNFKIENYEFSYDFSNIDKNGISVLASCHSNETSSFDEGRRLSLFTSFIFDALNYKSIIKKGKKYLTDISDLINFFSEKWFETHKNEAKQNFIYKTSKILPFYFDIFEYILKPTKNIYEETEDYIIYKVEPIHNINQKRYIVKICLRKPCYDKDKIAEFTMKIFNKLTKIDILNPNSKFEYIHQNKKTDVLFCYFGLCEEDIINSTWLFRTTITQQEELKKNYYRLNKNSSIVNNVYIIHENSYELIKQLTYCELSISEYISQTKEIVKSIIDSMKNLISLFIDSKNNLLSEKEMIADMQEYLININFNYYKLGNMPVSNTKIRSWSDLCVSLASQAHKITEYFFQYNNYNKDDKQLNYLINSDIVKYEEYLDKFSLTNIPCE